MCIVRYHTSYLLGNTSHSFMLPFFTVNIQAPPPWHVCPHWRQPLNLGAQAESGAAADTGLLLTTKQIGAVIFLLEHYDLYPPLITYPCHGSFLSPQTEYKDTMAAAPLLKTIVSRDSECMARKKIFAIFSLILCFGIFSSNSYPPTLPLFISQALDLKWRHPSSSPHEQQ